MKNISKSILLLGMLTSVTFAQEGIPDPADDYKKLQKEADKNVPVQKNVIKISNSPTQIKPSEHINLPQNQAAGITPEELRKVQLKYDKENARLNREHIQEMKKKAMKNTATVFDTMMARQKELEKLSQQNIQKGGDSTLVFKRAKEVQKEIADLNTKLTQNLEQESAEFQKMMKQRDVQQATETAMISVRPEKTTPNNQARPVDPRKPVPDSVIRSPAQADSKMGDPE